MTDWTKLADDETLNKTIRALKNSGIEVIVVDNRALAKAKVFELIPKGAEVMSSSSITLEEAGIYKELESGNYVSIRSELNATVGSMEPIKDDIRRRVSAPAYGIGSVHAVTQDGKILTASATGSQLAFYAYGAAHLIWVVGTQKIVKDFDMAIKRIYEYTLPLVSEQVHKLYGTPGVNVNKLLIFEREIVPGRVKLIFVKEKLGF